MRNRNICKFAPSSANDRFSVHNFVLETNPVSMAIPHTLSSHRVVLMTRGKGRLQLDSFSIPVEAGMLIFCFREERFILEPESACEYMYISFSGSRGDELFRRFDIQKRNRIFSGYDGLIPLWQESLARASEENVDLAAESMLLYSLSRLSGTAGPKSDVVSKIVEISEEAFTDPQLSIASIAEELGYNAKYLSHVFREKMGVLYSVYLRSLRLKHAVLLMDHGIDSVKNVALLSGFNDPLYFSTVFRNSTGISPKEYMAKVQEAQGDIPNR